MDFDERRKYKVKIKLYPLYPITSDFKENGTREKRGTGASLTKRQISRGLIRKTGMRKERGKNKDTTARARRAACCPLFNSRVSTVSP